MRKTVVLVAFLVVFIMNSTVLSAPSDAASATWNGSRPLIIATRSNYPPYEYFNPLKGEFEGFTIDILKALAEEMAVSVTYRQMGKTEGFAALEEGLVDGVLGVAYSIERDESLDFTSPLCILSDSIFVRETTTDIAGVVDLEGRTVAVDRDDFIGDVLRRGKGVHIVSTDSYEDALRLLNRGDVAAFVGNQLTGKYQILENQLRNIKIVGSPIHQVGYCIAVREENSALVSQFDKALDTITRNGEYDRIFEAWFGEGPPEPRHVSWPFFWTLCGIAGFLAFAGWLLNRRLRQKVETTEEELAESQEQLKRKADEYVALFERANDAILIIDPSDGRFLEVNKKAEELTGYSRQELLDMCMRDIHLPGDGARVDKRLAHVVAEGSAIFDDAPMLRKDGSVPYIDISASLIDYSGREVIQGFLRDVTERRLLEKQIVQTGKLASVGTFTAGLAHEIRNPLNSVNLQLLLLERRIRDGAKYSEEESLQLINIVREEVSRLDNLVTEFLFFAKPLNLDCHPNNVHRILDDVFALFHARMAQNGITLERDYADSLPLLSLDAEKIKQALINIVQNSIEAMTDGGTLRVTTRVEKKRVLISIEDTGAGIPEDDLDKLFEVFYTSKEKGTGLGLPISLHIIEMHGGTIDIRSADTEGTVCTITLGVGPARYQPQRREHSLGA